MNLPSLTSIGANGMYNAFQKCTSLTSADLSGLSSVTGANGMSGTFNGCTSLRNVKLNKLSDVSSSSNWGYMFNGCTALEKVDFSETVAIPSLATSTFNNTNSTFKIVVPDALYSQWIAATNWSTYASQIVKASEYI